MTETPLALYVHLPWCVHKCPYCDFNSHPLREDAPFADYTDALLADADGEAPRALGRTVQCIFFGGGTPSLFPPEDIARLLEGLNKRLSIAADAEITLEANPGTVEQKRFEGFRAAGVNRLSIGIQSFDPAKLQSLERIHGRDEALSAARAARAAGFENVNLDLMFGLPGQSVADARADLQQAIELEPAHISYYQLTLEPNTTFYRRPPVLPPEEAIAAMHAEGQALLDISGYRQYEVSAYAQPGRRSRHNLNYWLFGDYLAIGAGAHGKISGEQGIVRYSKRRSPRRYQEQPQTLESERWLEPADIVLEFMMNALRLNAGFRRDQCIARTGLPWSAFAPSVERGQALGLLEDDGAIVRPTERGRYFLNDLLELFVPEPE